MMAAERESSNSPHPSMSICVVVMDLIPSGVQIWVGCWTVTVILIRILVFVWQGTTVVVADAIVRLCCIGVGNLFGAFTTPITIWPVASTLVSLISRLKF